MTRSMSDTPMTPQEYVEEGKTAYEQEDFDGAVEAFLAAERGFLANQDELMAAEMANNRSVVLLQIGEAQAALEAVEHTPQVFSQANDDLRHAMALGNQAAALAALDQREQAEKTYWESAQILGEIGESDLRASVLQSISKLQMRSGRFMQAVASMESGLDQVEKPNFSQRIIKKLLRIPSSMLNK